MTDKRILDFVNSLCREWWSKDNYKQMFCQAYKDLLKHGLKTEEIEELLSNLYTAISDEYGN